MAAHVCYMTDDEVAINLRIASNLMEFRIKKGLTRRQLAQKVARHPDTIRLWESGTSSVPAFSLVVLAEAYDVPLVTFTRKSKTPA